jgi:hypothetical protein
MHPRLVDWTLFTLVTGAVISGFGSFLVGQPAGWWVFVLHGVAGLALLLVLVWKVRRVWPRVVDPQRWDGATSASIAALLAVGLVLLSGVVWTTWQWPAAFPNGMWWHVTLGILLATFLLLHTVARFKPLRVRNLRGRRNALQLLGVAGVGGLVWASNQGLNSLLETPGQRRRFTGSRQEGADFPVTMWMFDNPAPLDLSTWQLHIHGAVVRSQQLNYAQLVALGFDELEATLDCTSGWYSTRRWQGIKLGRLLELSQPASGAVAVRFQAITGYRWSLPLAEANAVLLATHVDGVRLDHGHGAPLRLVAPGRRGFQWVKWVTSVEVLTAIDYGQWGAIFVSGLRN